jgi:hypothetical protein
MKKAKRYQDGGLTISPTQPAAELPGLSGYGSSSNTYPFQSSSSAAPTGSEVSQTFNIQPSANAGQPQAMKKGGAVKAKAKVKAGRGDGIAQRGKTRGRMI